MSFRIEELSMNAWPALENILYDGWIIRFSNGYTKRANSINPIYKSTIDINEKEKYCYELFKNKKLPVIYKLVDCKEHRNLDGILESIGYEKIDITSVQTLNLAIFDYAPENDIRIENDFSEKWLNGFFDCNGIKEIYQKTIISMLQNISGKTIVVSKTINNKIVGCGYGAIEDDYVGIFDIIVNENERGNGYGQEIVKTILSVAKKNRIEKSYLQVVCGNTVAEKLYNKLGYKEEYKYWYRRKMV
jgi:N-acetylglutamate synthase